MRWVLRLIATEGDSRCLSTDLIEIRRREDAGDIANLGLTLGKRSSLRRAVNERSFPHNPSAMAAAAALLGLQRKMPFEGLAGTPYRDAGWRGEGAASAVSMHRLQTHRDERWLAIVLPIGT